ncbi:MAG: tRNA pseudouridine(38-40) synthase TruA [Kangiellaceae bacterium]|nr:tRNA pseudouridine(38-40) synthase TruA [Kangiellaceae bacterium]
MSIKVALGIEYSGEAYCGWQRQSHSPSVQQPLEEVLAKIANEPIRVFCAGRTDTAVHATGQVVHFELQNSRPRTAWIRGANSYLPSDISITWAEQVDANFHARFSALNRSYRYVIQNTEFPTATLAGKTTWVRNKLDVIAMHEGAQFLVGKHDFTSFRASTCQANTAVRTVEYVKVTQRSNLIIIDIKANAFLHHMVRNIVGSLLRIGELSEAPEFIDGLLQLKDRTKAPDTAKPDGLYLIGVDYPPEFHIPAAGFLPLGFDL